MLLCCKYNNNKSDYITCKEIIFIFYIFTALKLLIFKDITFCEKLMM